MERLFLFANPISGRGRGRQIARTLAAHLTAEGYQVHTFLQPALSLPPEQCRPDPSVRAIIVIGGDGTLRTVMRQVVQQSGCRDVPPLLIIPLGTANLMARHLGIDWSEPGFEDQVTRALRRRNVLHIDAAHLNDELFLLMAGVGIDAMVVHELDRIRRGPIGLLHYALPAALAITTYEYPPLTVHVDGAAVFGPRPAIAFVGNIREYGTGFPMLPRALPDDGLLDVCVIPCRSRKDVVQAFLLAAVGEHLHSEGVLYLKGRRIRIDSPAAVPVQVDGEAAGHTPCLVELLPTRIPFILPR